MCQNQKSYMWTCCIWFQRELCYVCALLWANHVGTVDQSLSALEKCSISPRFNPDKLKNWGFKHFSTWFFDFTVFRLRGFSTMRPRTYWGPWVPNFQTCVKNKISRYYTSLQCIECAFRHRNNYMNGG